MSPAPKLRRWRIRWRATFPDGRVVWYQNEETQAAHMPTPWRAKWHAEVFTPTAAVAYVTVREHVGPARRGTYGAPPPKGSSTRRRRK